MVVRKLFEDLCVILQVFVVLGVIVCCASAGYVDSNGWQSGGSSSGWPSSGGWTSSGSGSSGWSSGGSSEPTKIIKIVEESEIHLLIHTIFYTRKLSNKIIPNPYSKLLG